MTNEDPPTPKDELAVQESVSDWLERVRLGSDSAALKLWNHFLLRLTELACRKLRTAPNRVADEEDVVLMTFEACFRALRDGKYPDIRHRVDLWALLVTIAERKAIDQIRRATKGDKGVRGDSAFILKGESTQHGGIEREVETAEPTPELAAIVADEFRHLYGLLDDHKLELAMRLRLEGHTNRQIADKLGRSVPSVERYFKLIREIWNQADTND